MSFFLDLFKDVGKEVLGSVASGAVDSGFKALNGRIGTAREFKYQKKMVDYQNQIDRQNTFDQWGLNARGMLAAGLNPAGLASSGSTFVGQSAPSISQSHDNPNLTALAQIHNMQTQDETMKAQQKLMDSQSELYNSQAELNKEKTTGESITNSRLGDMLDQSINELSERANLHGREADFVNQNFKMAFLSMNELMRKIKLDNRFTEKTLEEITGRIKLNEQALLLMPLQQGLTIALTQEAYSQGQLNRAKAKEALSAVGVNAAHAKYFNALADGKIIDNKYADQVNLSTLFNMGQEGLLLQSQFKLNGALTQKVPYDISGQQLINEATNINNIINKTTMPYQMGVNGHSKGYAYWNEYWSKLGISSQVVKNVSGALK